MTAPDPGPDHPTRTGRSTDPPAGGTSIAITEGHRHVRRTRPAAGMLFFTFVTPDTPVWILIVLGVVFGFGLGNTIAPSTTRMTLATPPERSGSGSAVQNTVRQVGAVFGVAILSSIVSTVYSNNITPLLEGKGLPAEAFSAATESIGGTNEVADRLAAAGAAPVQAIEQLRQASVDSFMPALHTATLFSVGLLSVAMLIVAVWLPTKAQAAAWGAADAPATGTAGPANESGQPRTHALDETGGQSPGGAAGTDPVAVASGHDRAAHAVSTTTGPATDSTPGSSTPSGPVAATATRYGGHGRHAADGDAAAPASARRGRHAAPDPADGEPSER